MSFDLSSCASLRPAIVLSLCVLLGGLFCAGCVEDPTCEDLANCEISVDAGTTHTDSGVLTTSATVESSSPTVTTSDPPSSASGQSDGPPTSGLLTTGDSVETNLSDSSWGGSSGNTENTTSPGISATTDNRSPDGGVSETSDVLNGPDSGAHKLMPLGAGCAMSEECESAFCADGVCCNVACDQACARCDAPGSGGTCSDEVHDDACGILQCPTDSECRTYAGVELESNCASFGVCATAPTCTATDLVEGTACQNGAGTCDGQGQCVVPDKKLLGDPCSNAEECGSANCATSASGGLVCCDAVCEGVCEACAADGHCTGSLADDDRCSVLTCPSDTSCSSYASPLTNNRCAGAGQCVLQATHCAPVYEAEAVSCGSGLECNGAGSCVSVCTANQLWCNSQCINPNSSSHCGQCGNACTGGKSCVQGACSCSSGQDACSGTCYNLQTDAAHCGNCNTSCPSGSSCSGGVCQCPFAGQKLCSNTCVDAQNDTQNCGSCGNRCSSGAQCVQGDCKSWGTVVKVADGSLGGSFTTNITMDGSGNAFVAYMNQATTPALYVRRRAASSGTWATAQLMDATRNRGDFYTKGQVGVDSAGNALVIWGSDTGFGYSRYQTNSSSWAASAYVTTPSGMDVPRLAVSPAGDAFIAWDNQVASAGTEVWFRRYGAPANAWYTAEELDASSQESSCVGAVGADPSGNSLVVYSEAAQVYGRWWSASSQSWGGTANKLNEGYCNVSLAFDGSGTTLVTSAGSENIYGSIATSQTTWTTEPLAAQGELSARTHVSAFAGSGGDALVAIENYDNYRSIVVVGWSAATKSWQGITPLLTGSTSGEYNGVGLGLDASGSGFVVAVYTGTGEIYGRRRNSVTGAWETAAVLASIQGGTGSTASKAQIKVAPSGNAILVWAESDANGKSTVWSRYYQ